MPTNLSAEVLLVIKTPESSCHLIEARWCRFDFSLHSTNTIPIPDNVSVLQEN